MIHLFWIIPLCIIGILLLLVLVAVIKTLLTPAKVSEYKANENENESLRLAEKLSAMIKYDTTSHSGVDEAEKFRGFHKVLEELFPLVHKNLEKTEIDGNLLYYWDRPGIPCLVMSLHKY